MHDPIRPTLRIGNISIQTHRHRISNLPHHALRNPKKLNSAQASTHVYQIADQIFKRKKQSSGRKLQAENEGNQKPKFTAKKSSREPAALTTSPARDCPIPIPDFVKTLRWP
jgi:hypothetical protein